METTVSKELIFAHLAGQSTLLQRRLIEEWLLERSHQEQYYEWLEEWDRLNLQYYPDEDRLFRSLLEQIDTYGQSTVEISEKTFRFPVMWVAATALFIVSLLTGGYLLRQPLLYKTVETDYGEIRQELLPDGSSVTLNAHSQLRFRRFGFGQSTREVFLTGEATFAVRHLPNHRQFIVRTIKDFDVTVLGTEFTIYNRNRATQVVLHHGKVQIDYKNAAGPKRLTMLPGDLIKLEKSGGIQLLHPKHPEQLKAWQNHEFVFEQSSVQEIAQILTENYGLTVNIQGQALADRTVSGSYQARTADDLLNILTELLGINYNRQNNQVTLFE